MSHIISGRWFGSLAVLVAVSIPALSAEKNAKPNSTAVTAAQRVKEALRAEAAGDNDRRAELLSDAFRLASDLPEANWNLSRVQIGENWLNVEEAEEQAANDPKLAEYRKLRDEVGENPKLIRKLARWCLKNGWQDAAKLHYAQLLSRSDIDADARQEAIQRLDLRFVGGTWMTSEDFQAQLDKATSTNESISGFRPKLKKLQQLIDSGEHAQRERASQELGLIDDPRSIQALATFLQDGGPAFQESVIKQLAKFPDYSATEALAHFAVLSEFVIARHEAATALKSRPLHEHVPLLLSGLAAPIQSQFEVRALPNGVINYTHVFARETPQQKAISVAYNQIVPSFVPRRFTVPKGTRGLLLGVVFDDTMWHRESQLAQETFQRAQANELEVAFHSETIQASNRRVFEALTRSTEQQLPSTPQAWWQWWQDYNEYHWPKQTCVCYSSTYSHYTTPPPVQVVRGQSCFLAGTPVLTATGTAAIESLQAGDRVLSQDQESGEIAYKLVLRTTVRPQAKMVCITSGGEQITTTLGHPFWVAGHGWKMAKELKAGDLLHSLDGAKPIEKVEPTSEDKAYNLVVEDFNTYFVGEQRLLVHDNEFRKPTRAIVPGLIDEPTSVATATKQ